MPSNGNYQQNIVLRRTPPSAESLSEGQIVFALAPNRGMSMYTKRNGQIWISPFYKQQEKQVINELEVKNSAKFLRDINVKGNISGKQIYWHCHTASYSGTSKVYIAWQRSALSTTQEAYSKYIAPYDGKLIQVLARTESVAGSTVIGFHKEDDGTADPNSTATESITVNMSAANTTYEFDFTATSSFNKGDILALSMDATNAVNDTIITSVWEFDIVI